MSSSRASSASPGVYAGDPRLIGREFSHSLYWALSLVSRTSWPVCCPSEFTAGVEGLWWVTQEPDRRVLIPEIRRDVCEQMSIIPFPYQKIKRFYDMGSPETPETVRRQEGVAAAHWQEGEAWAAAVEAVYSARTDDDRAALLRKYAAAPNSRASAWALALLARGPTRPAVEFFRGLVADDRLYPGAQTRLDALLCRLDPEAWPASAARRALLGRWMTRGVQSPLFPAGCLRLEGAVHEGSVGPALIAELVRPALAEVEKTGESDFHLERLLVHPRYRPEDRAAGFRFLLDVVRTTKIAQLGSEAVRGLGDFRPLEPAEVALVRNLLAKETDPVIRANLGGVLRLAPVTPPPSPAPRPAAAGG